MLEIINGFAVEGRAAKCERYGSGHINTTYRAETEGGRAYILQRINDHIFRDVPALMANISAVTGHLRAKGLGSRRVLTLVPTKSGEHCLHIAAGENAGWYRMYEFITDAICLDQVETADDFRQSAIGFGEFQRDLADFDASTLTETIPMFHDTQNRFRQLHDAIKADPFNRAKDVRREIDFALAREAQAGEMLSMCRRGDLPLRVTHNDTKLNNVMLDAKTRRALCVIDLDTVMPGLAGNDFGDSIRFGASTAAEDERDLDRVWMNLDLFRTFAEGFLSACGARLCPAEIETLPLASKLMTLECGIRFLADHIQGDTYFRIHRENHNLDRARTQLKLVADMEDKMDEMARIVSGIAGCAK